MTRSPYGYHRWDGRHWRGVRPIRKRLERSYGVKSLSGIEINVKEDAK